jgi:hypothetical protein
MDMELLALLISAISALIALYAVREARKASQEADKLSKERNELIARIVVLEEGRDKERKSALSKARLEFSLIEKTSAKWSLRITNMGNAVARNIEVTSGGEPIEKNKRNFLLGHEIPKVLSPGNDFGFGVGHPHQVSEVLVSWTDDSGEQGSRSYAISG